MANKYIGETSAKYWKQKNDETYVNEEELVKITDLEESDSVEDDDLLIKGNPSTGKMLKIKIANFLDGIKEKLLGSTDISSVGDGTVTGAISENAKGVSDNADDIAKNKEETDAAIEDLSDDVDKKYDELNSALAAKSNSLSTQTFNVDNQTLDASSSTTVTIDVTRSGYTPIAAIGFRVATATNASGTTSLLNVYSCFLNGTIYNVSLRNTGSSSCNFRLYGYILYAAN